MLVLGNSIAFFVVVTVITVYKSYYVIANRKKSSKWEFGVRVSMCFVWLGYNFVWLAIFVVERRVGDGYGVDDMGQGLKYCGYIVMFLLLLGGFI